MADLKSILNDPNYTGANIETKQAIFDEYSASDSDYANANEATKLEIRKTYGLAEPTMVKEEVTETDDLALKTAVAGAAPLITKGAYSSPLNLKQTGQAIKAVAPRLAAEAVGTAVTGVPGATTVASQMIPGASKALGGSLPQTLQAGKQILGTGAKLAGRVVGPAGMALSAKEAYDVYNDPNATATDYIPPAVGAVASAPLAYKGLQAGGQLVNKSLQAISPNKAVAEVAEAQAKARGAQIANIGRKFALDKLIPGMASKVLGPISAVGGMVVPSASESDYKYQFPITGPAKGSEINQQTGQPWTRQELDAYYAQYPEEPGIIDQLSGFLSEQFSNNK